MIEDVRTPREPIFTPRLQLGFGLMAFGVGLMFLAGKVLPAPIPAAIAGGIALAFAGFVVVVVEALREPTSPPPDSAPPPPRTEVRRAP